MVKVLTIAGANLRRMLRDRSNIFFVFLFPIALILLIGVQFGSGVPPIVGVHSAGATDLAETILANLERSSSIEVGVYQDGGSLIEAVERGRANAGVFLPESIDEAVAAGELVSIGFVARPDGFGAELESIVASAVSEAMKPAGAARFAGLETGVGYEGAIGPARRLSGSLPGVEVSVSYQGEALFPSSLGRFDLGAPQQLTLFVFITSLTGSAALILTRQLGVSRRMLSTPTPIGVLLVGESAGRFGVALFQGVYIMVVTLIIFGVDWGDPLGAALVLVAFCAVGAGAAMLMGSVFTNDQQAGGVAVVASIGLAALGGAMVPIELFPPTMQQIALLTPHAWALDAFAELVRRGGTVVDILPQLGILALYAGVLLSLATWRLRVAITRA
jgi:ABC-2 type transport system permease protein